MAAKNNRLDCSANGSAPPQPSTMIFYRKTPAKTLSPIEPEYRLWYKGIFEQKYTRATTHRIAGGSNVVGCPEQILKPAYGDEQAVPRRLRVC